MPGVEATVSGIALDLSITFGNMIEIAVIAGGGIATLAVMKSKMSSLAEEIISYKQETTGALQELKVATSTQFTQVQDELKKLGDILVNQADQNRRIIHLEDDVREMKHGRGYVQGYRGIGGIGN